MITIASSAHLPEPLDPDAAIFVISVAAQLAGMHPQTLRTYDRLGIVTARRTRGRGRRYSPRDVQRLRLVQHLSQDEGINLEGIKRILAMEAEIERLRRQVDDLTMLLQAARTDPRSRTFTADTDGRVQLGRHLVRQLPRALPSA
ncbi:heat shock protein transcriptional repressor HspR [Microlunatus sp. Y2014]|uniref:heat shock protein transcriptional repressor HspR n=1 Tax=Microlunatus sp. Y2014 TaxID=3418488 RepID=UPI003DA78041